VIVLPPLLVGAVNVTVTCALPATTAPIPGADGTEAGVTEFDVIDGSPAPFAFTALTVQLTAVPLTSGDTERGELVPLADAVPHVARYPVIDLPPLLFGATKVKETLESPAAATTFVGTPGMVDGVTELEEVDAGPVPAAFIARTVQVTATPLVRPVTTIGIGIGTMGLYGLVTLAVPQVAM